MREHLFEDRAYFADVFEQIRGDREVEERALLELAAFKSWELFCLSEQRSIVVTNADGMI